VFLLLGDDETELGRTVNVSQHVKVAEDRGRQKTEDEG
jgi:hypothetical protein